MPLSRADFTAIAAALKDAKLVQPPESIRDYAACMLFQTANMAWEECCHAVASALATTNPRFHRDQFLAACGLTTSEQSS